VLRAGREQEDDVALLVPGDVVRLAAGSQVPADGVLLESDHLFVQQSALTGESFPVEKLAEGAVPEGVELEACARAVMMESSVISGTATMLVCRTGAATRIGDVARAIGAARGDLAFDRDLRRFGNFILRMALFLVLFVLLAGGIAHRPWLETFLFAIALAVGMTPELLPMVVTVSLSRGALRLAKHEVIVKHLSAMHNLGSMDVLCTDKTGTLTEARVRLVAHVDLDGRPSAAVLENAFLNSRFETGIRTPLEDAVIAGVPDAAALEGGWTRIAEVPFDFERRRVSVLLARGAQHRLCVKGAPADVLAHCDRWQDGDAARELTPDARARAQEQLRVLESQGYRVLGVAWKDAGPQSLHVGAADESAMVFAGFAAFEDPPKRDAGKALAALRKQGIAVNVVTGDSDRVTRHVCDELGMRINGVLLGHEAAQLDDRALAHRARRANLFCRFDPIQKERVIRALRAGGHVVGYLGDGINDAPALHAADVGISVDTAADTARASADLILTRHSLDALSVDAAEGRRTFANTRKYLLLETSSNFGNMASMAAAAVFLPFLPMLPAQILLNNLLYDLVSAALPLDRVEPQEETKPQVWDMRLLRRFMFALGPVSSLFDMLTFWVLLAVVGASVAQFQSGWFLESLATQVLAVFVMRTRGSAFGGHPHRALVACAAAVLALAAALPFTPLGGLFGLVPLPLPAYGVLALLTLAYLLALEVAKRRFWRVHARKRRPVAPGLTARPWESRPS
jgi:Mg2+-importing ATPase